MSRRPIKISHYSILSREFQSNLIKLQNYFLPLGSFLVKFRGGRRKNRLYFRQFSLIFDIKNVFFMISYNLLDSAIPRQFSRSTIHSYRSITPVYQLSCHLEVKKSTLFFGFFHQVTMLFISMQRNTIFQKVFTVDMPLF